MRVIRHIATIKEWKTVSIELKLIDWGDGEPQYDIRKWNGNEPMKGISLRKEDLIELYDAIQEELGYDVCDVKSETQDLSFEIAESDEEVLPFGLPVTSSDEKDLSNCETEEILNYRNVIVHDKFDSCVKEHHEYEEVLAIVSVYTKSGVEALTIPARHCKTCGAYYISSITYNNLIKKGRILCKVVTKNEYNKYIKNTAFGDLEFQSILAITGYNVNSKDALSDTCRQTILSRAINDGVYTKEKALNHISFLIKLNEDKDNMAYAVEKWKRDQEFLRGGIIGNTIKVAGVVM